LSGFSEQYETLFIHVPKVAGTSMEKAPFVSGDDHQPYWWFSDEVRERARFSFGFVRNPYDRFLSAITQGYYKDLRERGAAPQTDAERDRVFEHAREIVTHAARTGDQPGPLELGSTTEWKRLGYREDPLPHIEGWPYPVHLIPQHYFVAAPGMAGIGVDFVGRFERLHDDWRTVCERVGCDYELPHERNAQGVRKRHYSEFFTAETAAIVRKLYARDFEVFGYDEAL